jgi:hypothetical protein
MTDRDHFSDAEVDNMCAGLKQNAAKRRYLISLGLRVDRKPNGRPLVWRPGVQNEDKAPAKGPKWSKAPA